MNDQEEIRHCYNQMIEAMINKDRILLDNVLDNNFYLTHMTGIRQNKTEFINEILDGTLNYYKAQHKSIDINVSATRF